MMDITQNNLPIDRSSKRQQAFTVYVIRIPIIVFLALALRRIHPEQLLKFGLAAIFGVPLCFAIAYLFRKFLFVTRIL